MFHLQAWTASLDQSTLAGVTALADPAVYTSGFDIAVPDQLPYIGLAYGLGPNITLASLVSPTLRQMFTHRIAPLDVAALPSNVYPIEDFSDAPLALTPDEFLDAYGAESGAGATRMTIAAWLCDGPFRPVTGDIRTVRATASFTDVANVWTAGNIVFDEALPRGTYSVVGMRAESTNLQLARLVFRGFPWRPGVVGRASVGQPEYQLFRYGTMGEFGQFEHNVPPMIEVLANGADTATVLYLDVIKVA